MLVCVTIRVLIFQNFVNKASLYYPIPYFDLNVIFDLIFNSDFNLLYSQFNICLFHRFAVSVCNFQSVKSPVELNSLLSKFFSYIIWFVISPDKTQHWTTCKRGLYAKSYCFIETIA